MIFFVAPHEQTFPMEDFVQGNESGALRDRIRVLTYEEIFARRALPVGANSARSLGARLEGG